MNALYRILENPQYFAILGLVFLSVSAAVAGVALSFWRREGAGNRLSRLVAAEPAADGKRPLIIQDESQGFVAKVAKPLHQIIAPSKEATQKRLRLRLVQGGFRSRQALRNFLALKVIGAVLLPALYLLRFLFQPATPEALAICLLLAAGGFFLPNLALLQLVQRRQERLLKALPDALDLMLVCVEAGLGLNMALKRVGDEIRPMCKDLSDEFYLTNLEFQAGIPREECLRNMGQRTGVSELQALIAVLIQTNRLGTSLAKTLRVHTDAMRTKRRQVAEEKAAKLAVKLVFPMIFFIFPAMFVVLVGPAAIRIAKNLLPALGGP
ncbi:type II secretion system F family protein [Desulfuromonas versatilis]|nr:type II secretion system F family protein [Desulfuromonas versatilis]